jgi:broad specificity phosphatase PhoE
MVFLMSDSVSALSSKASNFATAVTSVPYKNPSGKWPDMAIQTGQELTISHREKLIAEGVVGIQRKVKILGKAVDRPEELIRTGDKNTKILHFQRHGQGFHNVLCAQYRELTGFPVDLESLDPKKNPMLRLEVLDSPLTEVGRRQCLNCQEEASLLNPELLIVSPLLRAIQSAELSWSAHRNGKVPWIAHEGCREELGLLVCNQRRTITDIQASYPDIDFSLCPDNEDTLFMPDRLETALEKTQRVYDFLNYVRELPQTEIAVVGHSAWLFNMCNAVMDIEDEALKSWFLTSEIRSMQVTFEDTEE